jgi:SPP1 gp7 family putative phage head morphogenesis protein
MSTKVFATNKPNAIVTNMNEKTERSSSYDPITYLRPYNPDDLYRKRDNYDIYDQMRLDDQVSVCLQMKKDLVLGAGFGFTAKDELQKEAVADLMSIFEEQVATPFDEQLEEVISAYEYGFSVSEKLFKLNGNKLSFSEFKTRHPNTWLLETDDKGAVSAYKQRGMKGGDVTLKPGSLMHYINKGRFQNPYGESDLRPAHEAWFAKREITKYFAIFLEKAASPIPVGKYPSGYKEDQKTGLLNILKKFQTKTALVVPKEMELEFLEAKNNGEVYRSAINIFNMFIGRCLMVPDLLGFQGGETSGGSYSLGKEQMRIFFMHIGRKRKYLERLINTHLVKPICSYNHGIFENYPKFKFNPISEESAYEAIKTWTGVVNSKFFSPSDDEINHVRSLLNFPEGEVNREVPGAQSTNVPTPSIPSNSSGINPAIDPNAQAVKEFKKSDMSDYAKKVNFKQIETQLDSYLDATMNELKPVVKFIYADLADQIQKKRIIERQDITKVEDLQVKKMKDLKVILKNAFKGQFQDAKKMAQQELFKSDFAVPLPTDEFMKFLEDETYGYIGDWSYSVTKAAKIAIIQAIKDGKALSEVLNMLEADGQEASLVSLERYARTKFTEVMNRGRLETFNESGIVSGYEYSAILDDRTSDICESLDGKIFKDGEQPIAPLHFNCRSLLIPITKYEEVKKWDTVPQSTIDKVQKGGFSIQ